MGWVQWKVMVEMMRIIQLCKVKGHSDATGNDK